MGWIVLIIIAIIVFWIWLSPKKQPVRKISTPSAITKVPPRVKGRESAIVKSLRLGYAKKLCIKMKYETGNPLPGEPAIKVRDIDIYGLGEEYFDAYCHYRGEQRTFKISRVISAELSDITYQIPSDYVASGWVTEGWGEIKDATLEDSAQLTTPNVPSSLKSQYIESRYAQKKRKRTSREGDKSGYSSDVPRIYTTHDWQKHFEESIRTPFPDEWSPALPYLHKAFNLEQEGADQIKIQEMIEKAYELDRDATTFYIGRLAIMKKTQANSREVE
jgi:hypothetical protein